MNKEKKSIPSRNEDDWPLPKNLGRNEDHKKYGYFYLAFFSHRFSSAPEGLNSFGSYIFPLSSTGLPDKKEQPN